MLKCEDFEVNTYIKAESKSDPQIWFIFYLTKLHYCGHELQDFSGYLVDSSPRAPRPWEAFSSFPEELVDFNFSQLPTCRLCKNLVLAAVDNPVFTSCWQCDLSL